MNIQLSTLHYATSQRIIEKIKGIPVEEVDHNSVLAIIHAIENCLGCAKTADEIARLILESSDVNTTIKQIFFNNLQPSDYFFPDKKMHQLIQSLNGRIST